MIKISKEEKNFLVAGGIKYGENGILSHGSHSKNKKYYATEDPKILSLLKQFHATK